MKSLIDFNAITEKLKHLPLNLLIHLHESQSEVAKLFVSHVCNEAEQRREIAGKMIRSGVAVMEAESIWVVFAKTDLGNVISGYQHKRYQN